MRAIDREAALLAGRSINPDTGCWEWTGRVGSHGYGYIGASDLCHRIAARLWLGFDGKGWVLHHCDNRLCFNPDHLYVGNGVDNARDGLSRRRMLVGAKNGHAKLTDREVAEIRTAIASGERQRIIATRYGIDQSTVSYIKTGHTWQG